MVPVVYVRAPPASSGGADPDSFPTIRYRPSDHTKNGRSSPALPSDLDDGELTAETEVAVSPNGPFSPLAIAVEDEPRVREAFATAQALPMLVRYRGIRLYLLLGLVPLLMLAELDRELSHAGIEGAGVRTVTQLFLAAVVATDLIRKIPRHPRTSALVLFGTAARYALLLAKTCGHGVHLVIFVAPIVALMAGIALITSAPSPTRVTREVRARLGVTASDVARIRKQKHPSQLHVLSAIVAGAGLPITLLCAQISGIGTWWQALLFAMYATAVPWAITNYFEPNLKITWPPWQRVALAVVLGFTLTLGITNGAHYGFDAAVNAVRCHDPTAFDEGNGKKILDAENVEVTKNVHQAREQWAYFAMTVLIVPIAEERVYRGLLQRLLVRRLGPRGGLAVAAVIFGLAHLGVYRIAVYQTVLLGASFGVAFGAGGIAASALTHALWNLHLLL